MRRCECSTRPPRAATAVLAACVRLAERRTVHRTGDAQRRVDRRSRRAPSAPGVVRGAARSEPAASAPQARGARRTRRRGPASKPAARNAGSDGLASALSPSSRSTGEALSGDPAAPRRRVHRARARRSRPRHPTAPAASGRRARRTARAAVAQHHVRAGGARCPPRRALGQGSAAPYGFAGSVAASTCRPLAAPRAGRAVLDRAGSANWAPPRPRRSSRGGRPGVSSREQRAVDGGEAAVHAPRLRRRARVTTPWRSSSSSAMRACALAGLCRVRRTAPRRRPAARAMRPRVRCGGGRGGARDARSLARRGRRAGRAQRREGVVRDLAGRDESQSVAVSSLWPRPGLPHQLAEEARLRREQRADRLVRVARGAARGARRRPEERGLVAEEQRRRGRPPAPIQTSSPVAHSSSSSPGGSPRHAARARRAPRRPVRAAATAAARARRAAGRAAPAAPLDAVPGRRKRASAAGSTGSTSRRSAATEARRIRRSTSGSHQSMPVPPGPQAAAHEPARDLEAGKLISATCSASP